MSTSSLDLLSAGHRAVIRALDELVAGAWTGYSAYWYTRGVRGDWSVKDLVSLLAAYERLLVDVLGALEEPRPTPVLDRYCADAERFAQREILHRRDRSIGEVLYEYEAMHDEARRLIARLPVELRRRSGLIAWYGAEADLDDLLLDRYYGYKRELAAQIEAFGRHLQRVLEARDTGAAA